jgi:SAM-dependent methyltransferase
MSDRLRDRATAYLRHVREEVLLRTITRLTRWLPPPVRFDPFHEQFGYFVDAVNKLDRPRVLEIGSRNVSGNVRRHLFPSVSEYVGFDIHAGDNVDVVGDAHRLSEALPRDHFDAVFCISVFEHLAMPWKVAVEMNRVLRKGGLVFVATHPTWPPHELPWDFWRYGSEAFKVLFNAGSGFELERVTEGLPCSIIPHGSADPGVARTPGFLGVAVTARKIAEADPELRWNVSVDEILRSSYPAPR